MSIQSYEFLSILQADQKTEEKIISNVNYLSVLEYVRSAIAKDHAEELAEALADASAVETLKKLILLYVTDYLAGKEYDREELVERIYQDMAGLGLLTAYLQDPSVEEININGFETIEVIRSKSIEFLTGERAFPSPGAALDIVKRMVRMGGMLLDAQTPRVDSYIGSGTRVSAIIPPLVPPEQGVIVSIRKQTKSRITREQVVSSGTATPDMLDFISTCLCNGVSVGIAGSTGSGKSTLMTYLLNEYIARNEDYNSRIYIIEDSRELNLIDYDKEHNRPARVLNTVTKGEPNPVSMYDLIKSSLRFDPQLIVPAEVRDGAAFQAAFAGQTGHTILTSFHANNATDAYNRLVGLCNMAQSQAGDERLLKMCIDAWPIMIFQKQLKDNTRRIMEVFEATGQKDGVVTGNMIYRYVVDEIKRNEQGRIVKVRGHHQQTGYISKRLYELLRDNGAPTEVLDKVKGKKNSDWEELSKC